MINVTKTYLPDFDTYIGVMKRAWDKAWITNNGELVQELEQKLKDFLGVKHLFFTNNGTVVLQMALKAFGITGEVITTPFSYVATTTAILWENCKPVFVDISPHDFCIDPEKIEQAITEKTQAILATHVFGMPCAIEKIQAIADKHRLKVIYDGAHAFGCKYQGKALLSYGDISTCSFHATKVFHTVEGGCVITHDDETARKLMLYRQFGHVGDDYFDIGINAKSSELHAAMGLCVLNEFPSIVAQRKQVAAQYDLLLAPTGLRCMRLPADLIYNYSYYFVLFRSEDELKKVQASLAGNDINPRRYFYPSLNTLPYIDVQACAISEDIASRILCLPMYAGLATDDIVRITSIIKATVNPPS